MKYSNYSITIIGSGITGLYLAYKLSLENNFKDGILLVTKANLSDSNSRYAQGGIVGVLPENRLDSVSLHVKDTLDSGCGLNNFNVVSFVSENSAKAIEDLIKIGVEFDRAEKNKLKFTLEGAHSIPRILHAGGDATGRIIDEKLCEIVKNAKNITIYEDTLAVELLCDENKDCKGVVVYKEDSDDYEAIYSGATILATGGAGQVYKYTTNPKTATGAGIVLAANAGAEIKDMEFVQFHPTALNVKNIENMPLISESVRGEGAVLIDNYGEDFTINYDKRGSLAPRDVVSRAICYHLQKKPDAKIYLDISPIGMEKFQKRFPTITKICEDANIDLSKMLIPVAPSAHYLMGGIKATVRGETNINNLYAVGECSCTGLHGANRLASNSLLECIVCARELYKKLSTNKPLPTKKINENIRKILSAYDEQVELQELDCISIKEQINNLMWSKIGIEREENGILEAMFELSEIEKLFAGRKCINFEHYETRNLLKTAQIIAKAALERKETIGAHYRTDGVPVEIKKTEDLAKSDKVFIK